MPRHSQRDDPHYFACSHVDVDVSREQIAAMGPDRPHIVLFVSEDDQALAASKEVWGAPRLGAINPNIEPYKSMLERENITVINLTKLPSHDEFNHGKFAEDPKVVELIGRSLASGQALTTRRLRPENHADHGERRNLRRSRRRPRGLGARRHCRSGDAGSLR
jgi:esterase/lipase superfamily enzyme